MEDEASSKLHKASTADGKGGTTISVNRKAMQASIHPAWAKEQEGDLIATLSRRVYDYTNEALGLGIEEKGQEPLMSIQYFGQGYNDTTPDRYTPHCDGKVRTCNRYQSCEDRIMVSNLKPLFHSAKVPLTWTVVEWQQW